MYNIRLVINHEVKETFNAKIFAIKEIKLADIDDYIAYLDTGYNVEKTKDILKKMYLSSQIDWDTQLLDYILLTKVLYPNKDLFD
jgi:transposase-like protein